MKVQDPLSKCHYDFHSNSNRGSEQMWTPRHAGPHVTAQPICPRRYTSWVTVVCGVCLLVHTLVPRGRQHDLQPPHHTLGQSLSQKRTEPGWVCSSKFDVDFEKHCRTGRARHRFCKVLLGGKLETPSAQTEQSCSVWSSGSEPGSCRRKVDWVPT